MVSPPTIAEQLAFYGPGVGLAVVVWFSLFARELLRGRLTMMSLWVLVTFVAVVLAATVYGSLFVSYAMQR